MLCWFLIVQGGKWVLTVKNSGPVEMLDSIWMELVREKHREREREREKMAAPCPCNYLPPTPLLQLMALIGEHMPQASMVNGAVVSRRKKGDRIALWTTRKDKKANLGVW